MNKIGISNYKLPSAKSKRGNDFQILSLQALSELKGVASEEVVAKTLRAVERAELHGCKHPFWNALAGCYTGIVGRMLILNESFPGITKIIGNGEVKKGDVLVSDFHTGMNYGYLGGDLDPVLVRVLESDGDIVTGMILSPQTWQDVGVGYFRNEVWFFISHKYKVLRTDRS